MSDICFAPEGEGSKITNMDKVELGTCMYMYVCIYRERKRRQGGGEGEGGKGEERGREGGRARKEGSTRNIDPSSCVCIYGRRGTVFFII